MRVTLLFAGIVYGGPSQTLAETRSAPAGLGWWRVVPPKEVSMQRWTVILAAVLLVGLIPLVQAQEGAEPEEKPQAEAKPAPREGASMLERFDLNKDGRVTWEEFQKVRSGFTRLDADGDGVLTRKDVEKLKQRHVAKREERRKEHARDGRRGRHPRGERQRRQAGCDCRCHRDQPRFRGPPRQDGPRGFRGRRPGRRGWDRPGRKEFGPRRGAGRGPGPGWDRGGEDWPRRGPPARDEDRRPPRDRR
jgi:hypothetical protein